MDRQANAGQREGGRATCRPPAELPPCQATCPVGLDIPGYVRLIAQGKPAEALSVILQKLPFPSICGRVCPRPCEAACNLGKIDEPVMINALKRFAVEYAPGGIEEPPPAKSSGTSVAVVGSGPAGLTAAYYLARLGHRVTVFEAAPRAGGL
ncbi:MAG: FAD-dependent oxidoreductase, partial [Chloroflexota bacterium]